MKYYDYVVSLGASCYTAILLKRINLQGASNIFDWSGGNIFEKCGIAGFSGKINMICNHFNNAFNFEDLEEFSRLENDTINRPVRNKKTGLQYIHDFPKDKSIKEEYPHYKLKYARRIERLYKTIELSNSVLFLFVLQGDVLPLKEVKHAERKINKLFQNKIDFLVIQNDNNIVDIKSQNINTHLKCVLFPKIFIGKKYNPKFEEYIKNEFITKYKIEFMQEITEKLKIYTRKLEKKVSDVDLINLSEYFDSKWYAQEYSLNEKNLAQHYLTIGYNQKMNPSLNFDGNKYIEKNLDVAKANINPLLHYIKYGQEEGRKVYPVIKKESI